MPASFSSGRLVYGLLLLAIVVGCSAPRQEWRGQAVEPSSQVSALTGTNWDSAEFSIDQLRGKVVVVFFGYTFCPDICPFTLAKLKQVKADLGATSQDLAVVFVTVDPHRDTIEKLASYVPNFDRDFYGVRVEQGELEELQDGWGLTVQYGQPKDGPGTDTFYYVDHTGTYFLIDASGRLRVTFPPNAEAEDLKADLAILLEEKPSSTDSPAASSATHESSPSAPTPMKTLPTLEGARVVLAGEMAALYVNIESAAEASEADRLLRIDSSAGGQLDLHETVLDGDIVRMEARPEGFVLAPGGRLELRPGGPHAMWMEPPAGGESVPVVLHFERAGAIEVMANLEGPAVEAANTETSTHEHAHRSDEDASDEDDGA